MGLFFLSLVSTFLAWCVFFSVDDQTDSWLYRSMAKSGIIICVVLLVAYAIVLVESMVF